MKFFITLFLIFSILSSFAEELTTDTFKDIEKSALAYAKTFGAKNVLVAIDIDNTLLKMPQNFGSDQWFNWQYENCVDVKKVPDYCISNNMGEFLDIQGQIFAVSDMYPSDEHVVNVVKNLQENGLNVILLTSRGPAFRDATERAIQKHKMDFSKSAIGSKKGYASTFKPYNLSNLKAAGISKDQATVAKLKNPRSVSYQNGIFMGSGQHKGIMLKSLLAKTQTKVSAIVFADDHEKHTKRMQQIFGKDKNYQLTTYRYSKIDPMVEEFKKSDKKEVIEAYKLYSEMKKKIFK